MIRNGLYALSVEMQDGLEGGDNGVIVLRDGTIRPSALAIRSFIALTEVDPGNRTRS
jgi:hypothetical protein